MLEVILDQFKEGFFVIFKNIGQYLVEGGVFCLEVYGYKFGVVLEILGDYLEIIEFYWSNVVDLQVVRVWNDS